MPKKSLKRNSGLKKRSTKRSIKKTGGKYSNVKPGQTVTLANGACARKLSNGRFKFIKKSQCKAKKSKKKTKKSVQRGGNCRHNCAQWHGSTMSQEYRDCIADC